MAVANQYQRHASDTGSVEVQVAALTENIKQLTEHIKKHKHDYASRRGLIKDVNGRRKLLQYLKQTQSDLYRQLIQKLDLREAAN